MTPDFFGDKPRIALIVIIVVAILFLATSLYLIPIATPINLTLDAIKVDNNGDVIGTAQISLNGYKFDYLFQKSRLDLYIHPFDEYASIIATDVYYNGQPMTGAIMKYEFSGETKAFEPDWMFVCYGALYSGKTYPVSVSLAFSPELDRWLFADHSGKIYYVASVSEDVQTADLIKYFQMMIY